MMEDDDDDDEEEEERGREERMVEIAKGNSELLDTTLFLL